MSQTVQPSSGIGIFLQLERAARHAASPEVLFFTIVNETRRLLEYRQAVLAIHKDSGKMRIQTVSGVAVLDPSAPYIRWMEKTLTILANQADVTKVHSVDPRSLPDTLRQSWTEWNAPHAVWCPLITPAGVTLGTLWLVRDQPWQENDILLLEQLTDSYAHAWAALRDRRWLWIPKIRQGFRWLLGLTLVVGSLSMPVQQSVLAPAEVVAQEPTTVAAPMDGVIKTFLVKPNAPVRKGDELLQFDDTDLRSNMEVTDKTLGIAMAEYRQASQGRFNDGDAKARLTALDAQVNMRSAELEQARRRLEKISVKADRDGVAVFADPQMWVGRPVQTGERILQIADPNRLELRAFLPVQDLIAFPAKADMELFLDIDPLQARWAYLIRVSYEAESTPIGVLAYRLTGIFKEGVPLMRIGLRGTAKIMGKHVPLALYLFRRPLSVLRQTFGF